MSNLQLIRDALPLTVNGVEVHDPVLVLYGMDWSLSILCPWAMTVGAESYSWEDEAIEDTAWEFVGRRIVGVRSASPEAFDPEFEFEGGLTLAVTADTDLDPWTLELPGIVVNGQRPR